MPESDNGHRPRNNVNFILHNWALLLLALVSGVMLAWPVIRGGAGGGVSPEGAVQLINREKAVVIDVCQPAEFAAGHVSGARNVPLADLSTRLPEVVKNKSLPVIFACQSGGRSSSAARTAQGLGYTQAVSLRGGLSGWRAANLPVEKA
jgi:rhodanese-related sulfurtransferase